VSARVALVPILALVASACAVDEVVVATIATDGGDAAVGGCKTNDDCDVTDFCARASCGDPTGVCTARKVLCDPGFAPSCGCDGVTYWNDCLRSRSGASASTPGECTTNVAKCNEPTASACPLPSGVASCARLLFPGAMCSPTISGRCWVLPGDCAMAGGPPDRWEQCGTRMCQPTCDAIRSGIPHRPERPGVCM